MENTASFIFRYLGGSNAVARICGIDRAWVYRWALPLAQNGRDGRIPDKYQPVLLAYAREQGIDLRPADFFDSARLAAVIAADPDKYRVRRGRKTRAAAQKREPRAKLSAAGAAARESEAVNGQT